MKKVYLAFVLAIFVLGVSCKKTDSLKGDNYGYYYDATIGGVHYREGLPLEGDDNKLAGSGIAGFNEIIFGSDISNINDGLTYFWAEKGIMYNYSSSTDADFRNFFKPGSYSFAPAGQSEGFKLGWVDKSGTPWTTDNGTGNQTGSTVKIISISDEMDPRGILYIRTKLEFSCKLYDENGNVKQASGTYVGLFGFIK